MNFLQNNFLGGILFIIVAPVVLVIVKYAEYAESRFAGPDGIGLTFEYGESKYSQLLEILYFPAKSLVQILVNWLRVGGLAVDLSADLLSMGVQNLAVFLAFLAWRVRRSKL